MKNKVLSFLFVAMMAVTILPANLALAQETACAEEELEQQGESSLEAEADDAYDTGYHGYYGGSATFKVLAHTDEQVTYAWYQYDLEMEEYTQIPDNQTNTLKLTNISKYGDYRCTVTAANGESANVDFEVAPQAGFRTEVPQDNIYVYQKASTTIMPKLVFNDDLDASQKTNLTYKWEMGFLDEQKWNQQEYPLDECLVYQEMLGSDESSMKILSVTDKCYYKFTATNAYGAHASEIFIVNPMTEVAFEMPTKFSYYKENSFYFKADKNTEATIGDYLIAKPGEQYVAVWSILGEDDEQVIAEQEYTIDADGRANIVLKQTADEMHAYVCRVYAAEDSEKTQPVAQQQYFLFVDSGLAVYFQPEYLYVNAGEQITLTPKTYVKDGYSIVGYKWYEEIYNSETNKVEYIPLNCTEASLKIIVDPAKKHYMCEVWDNEGNHAHGYVTFMKIYNLEVENYSENRLWLPGTNAVTLKTDASVRVGNLSYSWFDKEDVKLSSTTGSCTVHEPGIYEVNVKDDYGDEAEIKFVIEKPNKIENISAQKTVVSTKEDVIYKFVAPQTAEYQLYTQGNDITSCELFDGNGAMISWIVGADHEVAEGVDDNINFTHSFEKDKTYYIRLGVWGEETSDTFDFYIKGEGIPVAAPTPTPTPTPVVTPAPTTAPAGNTVIPTPMPTSGPVTNTKPVVAKDGNKVTTNANGEASISEVKKTTKKAITIPSKVNVAGVEYKVTSISQGALKNATKATTVTLPNTMKEIKANAFKGTSVKTVKMTVAKGNKVTVNKKAFKASKVNKVEVTVSKSESAKAIANMKAAFKKAGLKDGNIKIKKK